MIDWHVVAVCWIAMLGLGAAVLGSAQTARRLVGACRMTIARRTSRSASVTVGLKGQGESGQEPSKRPSPRSTLVHF
jgi:hypothetical protein